MKALLRLKIARTLPGSRVVPTWSRAPVQALVVSQRRTVLASTLYKPRISIEFLERARPREERVMVTPQSLEKLRLTRRGRSGPHSAPMMIVLDQHRLVVAAVRKQIHSAELLRFRTQWELVGPVIDSP